MLIPSPCMATGVHMTTNGRRQVPGDQMFQLLVQDVFMTLRRLGNGCCGQATTVDRDEDNNKDSPMNKNTLHIS